MISYKENALDNHDLLKEIFKMLTSEVYTKLCLVSKKWKKLAEESSLFMKLIFKKIAITPDDWNCKGPLISENEIELAYKSLPKNLIEILKILAPMQSEQRIMDTYKLVWIPEVVNSENLTLKVFKDIFIKKHPETFNKLSIEEFDKVISPGWILVANKPIATTLNVYNFCNYSSFEKFLKDQNQIYETGWKTPKLTEAIICLSMIHLKFGNCLSTNLYSWCQESLGDSRFAIKWEAASSLHINDYRASYNFIGVAPLWRL